MVSVPLAAPSSAPPLIDVNRLSVALTRNGRSVELVSNLSFSIAPGRTLCIVGESGCGKSLTALSIMGLLATPPLAVTGGEIAFQGENLLTLPAGRRADLRGDKMTMIFQEPMTSLNPAFTIGNQIAEVILRHRRVSRAEAMRSALDVLTRVRIPAPERRLKDYPHQMSGGMRQRVMIAMALANSPRLLIADEPTTALDVTIQAQILSLIAQLQRETGASMLLITHDLGVVAEVADDVAVMYAGRIVESGPVGAIFDDPQHPYTIGLMGSLPSTGPRQGKLETIPGSVPPPDSFGPGCRFAPRCPFGDAHCAASLPALEPVPNGAMSHSVACWKAPLERHVAGSPT